MSQQGLRWNGSSLRSPFPPRHLQVRLAHVLSQNLHTQGLGGSRDQLGSAPRRCSQTTAPQPLSHIRPLQLMPLSPIQTPSFLLSLHDPPFPDALPSHPISCRHAGGFQHPCGSTLSHPDLSAAPHPLLQLPFIPLHPSHPLPKTHPGSDRRPKPSQDGLCLVASSYPSHTYALWKPAPLSFLFSLESVNLDFYGSYKLPLPCPWLTPCGKKKQNKTNKQTKKPNGSQTIHLL